MFLVVYIFFNILKVCVMKPLLFEPQYASFIDGKVINCIRRVKTKKKRSFFCLREENKNESQGRYKRI